MCARAPAVSKCLCLRLRVPRAHGAAISSAFSCMCCECGLLCSVSSFDVRRLINTRLLSPPIYLSIPLLRYPPPDERPPSLYSRSFGVLLYALVRVLLPQMHACTRTHVHTRTNTHDPPTQCNGKDVLAEEVPGSGGKTQCDLQNTIVCWGRNNEGQSEVCT